MRLLFSRDPISRNLRRFLFTATAAGALACFQAPARADGVAAVQFNDGQYLNILGAYGPAASASGPDATYTAYEVINMNVGTPSATTYAWQVNWYQNTSLNGWQMLTDIAGTSNVTGSTSGITTTTNSPQGDANLTINSTFYGGMYNEHFVDNFVYSGTTGEDNWDFAIGSYNPADLSATNPQGMTWNFPDSYGIDDATITNGEFIGFVDDYPTSNPILPEIASVPEPSQALLGTMVITCLLAIRPFRRAKA